MACRTAASSSGCSFNWSPILSAARPRLWAFLGLLFLVPLPSLAIIDGWYDNWHVVGRTLFAFDKFWLLAVPLVWLFLVDKAKTSWSPLRRGGIMPGIAIGLLSALVIIGVFILIRPGVRLEGVRGMASLAGMTTPLQIAVGKQVNRIRLITGMHRGKSRGPHAGANQDQFPRQSLHPSVQIVAGKILIKLRTEH